MKKAIIITGPGYQDSEVIYPFYRLQEDDFYVDIASFVTGDIYGILGTKMNATKTFSELKVKEYDLLILPGGVKSIEKVRLEKKVIDFVKEWYEKDKIIGSICHGAQLMISAKIIHGKKISGYYSIKDDIENAGAKFIDAPFVTDGNIISSPHYKYLGPWMKEVLKRFYSKNDTKN